MFKETSEAVVKYVAEHKNVILGTVIIFIVDEFVFKGKFRDRILAIADALLKRIEDKVRGI